MAILLQILGFQAGISSTDGLEESNNNVRKRCVVLHSYSTILPFQIYPFRSARSKGCVMISPRAMKKIDTMLKGKKGVLLETYY